MSKERIKRDQKKMQQAYKMEIKGHGAEKERMFVGD